MSIQEQLGCRLPLASKYNKHKGISWDEPPIPSSGLAALGTICSKPDALETLPSPLILPARIEYSLHVSIMYIIHVIDYKSFTFFYCTS